MKTGRGKASAINPEKIKWNPRGSAQQKHWDSICPGLFMTVYPAPGDKRKTGRRVWGGRFAAGDGKQRLLMLGDYPTMTLADAREKFTRLRASPADPRLALRAGETMGELLTLMLNDKRFPLASLSPGYKANLESNIRAHLKPLLPLRIEQITADSILPRVDTLLDTQRYGAAKNLLGNIGTFYKSLTAHPSYRLTRNPLTGITVHIPDSKPRERILGWEELAHLYQEKSVHQDLFQLLILSGQRIGQIQQLRGDQIKGDSIIWQAPDMKGKRDHVLPLTERMAEILERSANNAKWVFPGRGSYRTHATLLAALYRHQGDCGERYRPHDIRRTFITRLSEADCDYMDLKRTVAHSIAGVTEQSYIRSDFIPQKLKVLEQWESLLIEQGVIPISYRWENEVPQPFCT